LAGVRSALNRDSQETYWVTELLALNLTKTAAGGNGKLDPTFFYVDQCFVFEGAGVVSKWAIESSNELCSKDYSAISDSEFEMTYSALASGDRQAAAAC
jgi:hypothetical protein